MSGLEKYRESVPGLRVQRSLARLGYETTLVSARVFARAEVEAAKVDAVATVTAKALQDVAVLSRLEQSLAETVPHASGRLAVIADLAAVSLADVVANT
ncbi:MAG: hypothetical protein ACRCYU_22225, partial [Nocardioides sp.]